MIRRGRVQRPRRFLVAVLAVLVACVGSFGRERMLPLPEPLAVHADGALSQGEQRRLAEIRRALAPYDQEVLEQTLENLATDPRLPKPDADAALRRSLAGYVSPAQFCERLARELGAFKLTGPEVEPPPFVAVAVPIEVAHAGWLGSEGRRRYPDPRSLARAVRDGEFERASLDPTVLLGGSEGVLFVTDGVVLEGRGPSAAGRLCLAGPPSRSYVVARLPAENLVAPLRIPTTADAVCRPRFAPAPAEAGSGINCAGNPEFVTAPHPLGVATEFRLSR